MSSVILVTPKGEMTRHTVLVDDIYVLVILRDMVGGNVEIIPLRGRRYLVLNGEGKLLRLPPNALATKLAHDSQSIPPSDYIAGNAVIVPASLLD